MRKEYRLRLKGRLSNGVKRFRAGNEQAGRFGAGEYLWHKLGLIGFVFSSRPALHHLGNEFFVELADNGLYGSSTVVLNQRRNGRRQRDCWRGLLPERIIIVGK